jgi:hypothetical protein
MYVESFKTPRRDVPSPVHLSMVGCIISPLTVRGRNFESFEGSLALYHTTASLWGGFLSLWIRFPSSVSCVYH